MKIGINNIFTTFGFFGMFSCGGTLSYFAFYQEIFKSDLMFVAKFFVGLVLLITIGLLLYFVYKFRILIVAEDKIVLLYPFRFKKVKIDLNVIKKIKLDNFYAFKGTVYRRVEITDAKVTIEINDLEFENFERLIPTLKVDPEIKNKMDFEQAKSNLPNINFNVFILSIFLVFLVFNTIWNSGFNIISMAIFISVGFLLYASVKRKIKYKRILKSIDLSS